VNRNVEEMRTKLAKVVMTLALGTLAAGLMVLTQSGVARQGPQQRPAAVAPHLEGNLIVDWVPVKVGMEKVEITVDAARHCVNLAYTSVKRDSRPNDAVVRLDLERGKTYTVTASGEAFMSSQTGVDADPFPGVFVLYGTDEEDCYATRQIVLAPGKSITFRSPWLIDPASDVSLLAFFLDVWPDSPNRGSYKLTVTQASKEDASKVPPGTLQTP
jgi:hypothetical protein